MSGGLRKNRRPVDASLPRETTRDTGLSYFELGLLLWIMDRPDGWSIRAAHMAAEGKLPDGTNADGNPHRREGRVAIQNGLMRGLAPRGYYRLERRRLLSGRTVMGTAASEYPVESWAEQFRLFGGKAVPMVEQEDGTFLVLYPDGSTGPDDCSPPEGAFDPQPDLAADDSLDDLGNETAGQTGDQKPASGDVSTPTGSRFPGPGFPGPGFPGPGNLPPKGKQEEKVFVEKDPPPNPHDVPAAAAPQGGEGEDPFPDEHAAMTAYVTWFWCRRRDWQRGVIGEVLARAQEERKVTLRQAALVLAELVDDRHQPTQSPRRMLLDGPWWAVLQPKRQPRQRSTERCSDHPTEPKRTCGHCLGAKKAKVEEPPAPAPRAPGAPASLARAAIERSLAATLERVRERQAQPSGAEGAA